MPVGNDPAVAGIATILPLDEDRPSLTSARQRHQVGQRSRLNPVHRGRALDGLSLELATLALSVALRGKLEAHGSEIGTRRTRGRSAEPLESSE